MNPITIYKDLAGTFVAYIDVRGATTNQTRARLLLGLENRTLLFEGNIVGNKVTIKYPRLTDLEETRAALVLEVIADDVYFRAFEAVAHLEYKRAIDVQAVQVEVEPIVVTVDTVEAVADPEEERTEEAVTETEEEQQEENRKLTLVRSDATPNYKRFIKQSIGDYDELEKTDKTELRKAIRTYEPTEKVLAWGESVFNDLENFQARMCMYLLQQKLEDTLRGINRCHTS